MHDIRPYLPELFTQPGNLLYIGARPDACSWLTELYEAGHTITVLEIWPANLLGLFKDYRIDSVVSGDVRSVLDSSRNAFWRGKRFDTIFWWHGPEHLQRVEIVPVLAALESYTKLIAIACPWGVYPQGAHGGNPAEIHQSSLYPEDFLEWGYEVRTDGIADEPGSEVVAWKWVR